MRALIFKIQENKNSKRIAIEEREIELDEENITPTFRFLSIDDDIGSVSKIDIVARDK